MSGRLPDLRRVMRHARRAVGVARDACRRVRVFVGACGSSSVCGESSLGLAYLCALGGGATLYQRGIVFAFGGSTFGAQIACVAASAALLVGAALLATRMRWETACQCQTTRTHRHRAQLPRDAPGDEEEAMYFISSPSGLAEGDVDVDVDPSRKSLRCRRAEWLVAVRRFILVPAPLMMPVAWSVGAFTDSSAAAGTALSAQINVLLFSAIGGALATVLAAAYLAVTYRRARQAAQGLVCAGVIMALYTWLAWGRAQTAYLRGIHTPALVLDPNLLLHDLTSGDSHTFDLLAHNPRLRDALRNIHGGYDDDLRLSLLDSTEEVSRRHSSFARGCVIHPHAHLAELLPRRAANFFTGPDACPTQPQFARLEWEPPAPTEMQPQLSRSSALSPDATPVGAQAVLHIDCPRSAGVLSFSASPDFIGAREEQTHVLDRHHREVFLPEVSAAQSHDASQGHLDAERARLVDQQSDDGVRLCTGQHAFFRAQCGAHEQFFLRHVEKPEVTRRAADLMRHRLFKREYDAIEAAGSRNNTRESTAAGTEGSASTSSPQSTSHPASSSASASLPVSPLLENPPILLLFIDCLSRSHFHRALPLTSAVMRRAHRDSRESRESRERVYVLQQQRQRLRERHARRTADAHSASADTESEAQYRRDLADVDARIMSTLESTPAPLDDVAPQFSVYESYAYHVVDYHTRGNMQAMMCGSGASGWGGSLRAGPDATHFLGRGEPPSSRGAAPLACDARDLLTRRLERAGYVTVFAQNECSDLLHYLFQASSRGAAADYEVIAPFCHEEYDARGRWSNFAGPFSMRRRCIAGRHVHEYMFDYAREFVRQHDASRVPWFLHLMLIEAHEGSLAVLALIDEALAAFLTYVLFETATPPIVLIVSDHGSHMGPFAEFTRAGHIEHRLPALFTVVPERWLHHRDIHVKRANLRAFSTTHDASTEEPAQNGDTASSVDQAASSYYTLHADAHSSSPFSVHPPSRSAEIGTSLGLALHEGQHALVTAREVYWLIRGIPARTSRDADADEERTREAVWRDTQQAAAAAHHQQRIKHAGDTGALDELVLSSFFHPLSRARLDESDASDHPPSHPDWRLPPFSPLSLATHVPADRTCADAGIIDDLCVCGKFAS